MKQVADGVWQLSTRVPNAINCYLAGDVLIDTGGRRMAPRILRQLQGHAVREVAITHAHPDHQGGAHAICTALGLPLACPAAEVGRMDGSEAMPSSSAYSKLVKRLFAGPPHPVDRALQEGDRVGDFTVYEARGHSPGHIVFFREADGLVIVGDVLANMNIQTGMPGLQAPPDAVNEIPELVPAAIQKVAELRPRVVCFGHGAVLRDPEKLQRLAAGLG